ncbi:glycosyltransferase family 4 protein [Chryseolinea lacunae]|uniref:Undecaprenyl/decaprenyl-phosphate alpha-N-acetylglucosaminyl 1-phosphate transferase n=1 Tax=Chryseolinea lacunae TaxID=2801331 RepID=A0ABS1L2F6_9BACT|nr:MraY family glycosyltransferase [Chryseolinea lacunae]MBL0745845.1 undecaprenyl/decaprenyl-phosphate alpha-N-acetylglucosaminyl 1-phosphate transferase [Chryseolinea lacunae]
MKMIFENFLPATVALIFSMVVIPVFKSLAWKVGLVDRPNARKVHDQPVPLVGGISIAVTTALALLLSPAFLHALNQHWALLGGALVLLATGVLDDRLNIKPVYRLFIQLASAYVVCSSGIRITSLYGIFGIDEIPLALQYGLTMIVITGVVNAYNLMDGVDGLLGGLTLIGFSVLAIIAFQLRQYDLAVLYITLVGAVIGFLYHNLSKNKIFMGDGGSLFLGFILSVSAITLLNTAGTGGPVEQVKVLLLVSGIFLVPVLDSLRVYRSRIKKGVSPFTADKTHLHHLFLQLGLTHKKTSILISITVTCVLLITAGLIYLIPVTWVILSAVLLFAAVTSLLNVNRSVVEWKKILEKMESGK